MGGCECPCHEAFWAEYAAAEAADERMNSSSPEVDTSDLPQQAMEVFRRDNQQTDFCLPKVRDNPAGKVNSV